MVYALGMDLLEIAGRMDEEIAERTARRDQYVAALTLENAEILELEQHRRGLQMILQRYGDDETRIKVAQEENDEVQEWRALTKGDAVERALREGGEMGPVELVHFLAAKGRQPDSAANISAALSHLKRTRQTVERTGYARWRYVEKTPVLLLRAVAESLTDITRNREVLNSLGAAARVQQQVEPATTQEVTSDANAL